MVRAAARLAALTVLSAACSGGEPAGADAGPAVPYRSTLIGEPAPAIERFHLTLESPGSEPRRALRYRAPAGGHERIHIWTDQSIDVFVAGRRVNKVAPPTTEVSFELDVARQAGGYRCTGWITDTSSADWERMAPGGGRELRSALEQLRGHRVTFEVDERGMPGATSITLPDTLETNRAEALDVLHAVNGAVVPFPSEPVGVGAKWSVAFFEPGRSNLAGSVTFTYELIAVRGDRLELTMTFAPPSEPSPLSLEASQVSGYRSGSGSGAFKIALDLGRLMPDISGEVATDIEGRTFIGSEELPFRAHAVSRQRIESR